MFVHAPWIALATSGCTNPESHKTEHHGRGRVIAIGPRAQAVLLPYLLRKATTFCFSPRESEVRWMGASSTDMTRRL